MDGDKNVSPFRASAVDLGGKSSRETFDVILPHEVVEYFELKPWARWQELSYVDWSGFCLMDTLGNILGVLDPEVLQNILTLINCKVSCLGFVWDRLNIYSQCQNLNLPKSKSENSEMDVSEDNFWKIFKKKIKKKKKKGNFTRKLEYLFTCLGKW